MATYKRNVKYGSVTYDYAGKTITGTSRAAKAFPKSGLPEVEAGDKYVNVSTGCTYRCAKGGNPDKATWEYRSTIIIGRPVVGVTGLKLVRRSGGSRVMEASWKVPDAVTTDADGKGGRRATGLRRRWKFDTSAKGKVNILDKEDTARETNSSASENLASFSVRSGGKTVSYSRASFYPHTGKPKLRSVTFWVDPFNGYGSGGKTLDGKHDVAKSVTYTFKKPRKPSVSALSFDGDTGVVSGTITTDPGEDEQERLWTQWEVEVTDTSKAKGQTWIHKSKADDTATSRSFSYDASGYQSLTNSQYIRVRVRARARGFAGNSAWTDWKAYYVARPKAVTIEPKGTKVRVSSNRSAGRVTVPISVNATTEHPTDRVQLQVLANVDYATSGSIPAGANWSDAGAGDNGRCKALVADLQDFPTDAGKHTWIRVKSWHGSEENLCTYSKYREMTELYSAAPTASDDECAIVDGTPLTGGDAIRLVIGYDRRDGSTRDDADGTAIEWSDDPDAWISNQRPDPFEADWVDKTTDPKAAADYYRSQNVKVKGLEEGVTYHFRARRYKDGADGTRTYGPYSKTYRRATVSLPGEGGEDAPMAVSLRAPVTVREGGAVALEWTVAAAAEQTMWQVISSGGQVLASGAAEGACTIPWERVAPALADGTLTCHVRVHAGGEYADSAAATVRVSAPPDLIVSAGTLVAQPLVLAVESDVPAIELSLAVRAEGCSGSSPSGAYYQAEGDVVYGGTPDVTLQPVEWADSAARARLVASLADAQAALSAAQDAASSIHEGDEGYEDAQAAVAAAQATVDGLTAELAAGGTRYAGTATLPSGLDFHDGALYRVEASATDAATGLASERATTGFSVAWSHQAPVPSELVSVEPLEEDGGRSARITLVAPEDAGTDDVYDVYRVTHDGAVLVSRPQGLPLDFVTVDAYAPFGDAADYCYRVALRTPDGDVEWSDYPYVMDPGVLRIDFAGRSVELPYDIAIGDSFEKDVEVRAHMDGSVEGYWNQAVRRKATLSTTVLRIEDADVAEAVRALAQHAGPAYVRTPDGSAYQADVQVGGLDVEGEALLCTLDARQTDTGQEFMLPLPDGGTEEG